MIANEIWKQVKNFPKYEVSNFGNVRSSLRDSGVRLLKGSLTSSGYLQVCLCVWDVQKRATVHSLVARAFIGERPEGFQINHKNGIKTDNRAENLEYVSHKQNAIHASETGLLAKGGKHGKSKLVEAQVLEIHRRYDTEKTADLSKEFGVSTNQIRLIGTGQNWKHLFV